MSIRENRRKLSEETDDLIRAAEAQIETSTKERNILRLAQSVLAEEPRAETKCGLTLHYALTSGYFQKADCSECGETVQGYQKNWRYCPCCSSTIITTETEETPNDRLARSAVKEAVAAALNT